MRYADYEHLQFEPRPNGVLLVTINRPHVLNATNDRLHWELTQIWLTIDADPATRVEVPFEDGTAVCRALTRSQVDEASKPGGFCRAVKGERVFAGVDDDECLVGAGESGDQGCIVHVSHMHDSDALQLV